MLEGDVTADVDGAASVYTYNGSTLSAYSALTRPAGASAFGTSVAISGNGSTAVVGDPVQLRRDDRNRGHGDRVHLHRVSVVLRDRVGRPIHRARVRELGGDLRQRKRDPGRGPAGRANSTGAVTEFTLSGGTWSAGTALSTPATTYTFGTTVALSANGNVALVADPGAPDGGVGDPLHPR